jgi:hypothetical protein
MTEYSEFRLLLTPDVTNPGHWRAEIRDSPDTNLIGETVSFRPSFTRDQLQLLRDRNGWPNLDELRGIGGAVWESVMGGIMGKYFKLSRHKALDLDKRRMRLRLVLHAQDEEVVENGGVRISELPVEAIYEATLSFLATDLNTPISRGLDKEPNVEPLNVGLPLRMLVVVSTPSDKSPALAADEVKAIKDALGDLTEEGGPIQLDFCEPPTRNELLRRLQDKPYHILHFIGHGAFGVVENDPSQRPHICLVREDNGKSDPLDAETFLAMVRNTQVRLLLMTACSSAAPTPDRMPYGVSAFDGLAQRLMLDPSGKLAAAVAMQFDIESPAAVIFTHSFYKNLLNADRSLDEIVTQARLDISVAPKMGTGHRAWVTPVVYWRCKGGKVFDINPVIKPLDEESLIKLQKLNTAIEIWRVPLKKLTDLMQGLPPDVRRLMADDVKFYQDKIVEAQKERAALMGETLQLWGGNVKAGQEVDCRVVLRLLTHRQIDSVEMTVRYNPEKVSYVSNAPGGDFAGGPLVVEQKAADTIKLTLVNPTGGRSLEPGKYEIALLRFKAAPDLRQEMTDLKVESLKVTRGLSALPLKGLHGVIFIDESG